MLALEWCGYVRLSLQIDNGRVFFTLLSMVEIQVDCLLAPQTTGKQDCA
jgi:hypothetical protein